MAAKSFAVLLWRDLETVLSAHQCRDKRPSQGVFSRSISCQKARKGLAFERKEAVFEGVCLLFSTRGRFLRCLFGDTYSESPIPRGCFWGEGGGLPTLCQVLSSRDPAAGQGVKEPRRQAGLRWGSKRVLVESIEVSTLSHRSAMLRKALPWECPRARSCAYAFLLAWSHTTLVRAQW